MLKAKRFIARYAAVTIMMGTVFFVATYKFFLFEPPAPDKK
ncbi:MULTISPECIES: hypothetical protein [Paenibacillus]|uniref:Cyclic lactone autoinducer peptide n=1 Tax=Paenibacillus vandeheii TaxID=3035917 RepID=A0ABT8JH91_9BACL|nr:MULTISPECIES: hypothetical protein [Paenibacillus]MDN4603946.1 hypothetical protein [Paenibacillus vandeheii]